MTSRSKRKLLFIAYGAGHIAMLIPIINRLRTNSANEVVTLALTTAQQKLDALGIPYVGYRMFHAMSPDREKISQVGERLLGDQSGAVTREESIAYLGINYIEMEKVHGVERAREIYASRGRQAFFPLGFMKQVLEYFAPDLVIATNSPRSEQAAITAAGELGIPSLCLVDLFATQEVAWIGKRGYASRVAVLSEKVKDMLVTKGRSSSDIVVTGNPAFDVLARSDVRERGVALRAARGWARTEKVILCATQGEPEHHPFTGQPGNPALPRMIEQALFALVARHPEYRLVLRRHPSEHAPIDQLPEGVVLSDFSEPLAELLHAVDLVVVTASTVGLEAALVGKPVVSVDMSVFTADAPYSAMGIALGVDNLDALEGAIAGALHDTRASYNALMTDGHATERIIAEIEAMTA